MSLGMNDKEQELRLRTSGSGFQRSFAESSSKNAAAVSPNRRTGVPWKRVLYSIVVLYVLFIAYRVLFASKTEPPRIVYANRCV